MGRNDKLIQRLEMLEAELRSRLIVELEKEASGQHSIYIDRRMGAYTGTSHHGPDTDAIDKLEREVRELRGKFAMEPHGGPAEVLNGWTYYMPLGERARRAREALLLLKEAQK